ncbi:MAG: protein kinase [Pyrinomonadaceae bacterium]|nr:protein kinase [Pyrinomonadaceae bacterium]
MADLDFTGQTLDGKYQMTRELGRGGMGTVYLATHLGTERPVAVKIIAPQFMQRAEFVERFRREARAAGRLRHPNVVNVTDFGFAETNDGQVAYLVMEYLDGCTLGEILDEEKNLPVAWTLDILEQVCSAVHEAHLQGIIHRDLKPDNIWLEPNQRGGYTVKVLDFGIAKLEDHDVPSAIDGSWHEVSPLSNTQVSSAKTTFAGTEPGGTFAGVAATHVGEGDTIARTGEHQTPVSEAGTVILEPLVSEAATAIYDDGDISDQDTIGTRISSKPGTTSVENSRSGSSSGAKHTPTRSLYDSKNSAELTRVGAVLGTPLYMSPEQCRGEHLDPRSDIYSLAVIAYQMLSGRPPFEGDFKDVMDAHQNLQPAPLKARSVRKKLRRSIHGALSKDPSMRPQTAEGFASELRSRSEGLFGLLRRALVIYSEHLPKFLMLTAFLFLPSSVITLALVVMSYLKVSESVSDPIANVSIGVLGIVLTVANAFCGSLIMGTITWIVTQHLAVPLRPLRLRPVLYEARRKWKRFAGAGAIVAMLPFVFAALGALAGFIVFGAILGILYPLTGSVDAIFIAGGIGATIGTIAGFFGAYIKWMLVAPVVMMEKVGIREALRRSRILIDRSFATATGAAIMMFLIPAIAAATISLAVNVTARAFDPKPEKQNEAIQTDKSDSSAVEAPAQLSASEPATDPAQPATEKAADEATAPNDREWNFNLGQRKIAGGREMDMRTRVKHTLLESLIQIIWLPMQIFVFSFSGIIVALLYLKTRLAGGESMNDLTERFEDDGRPRKKWQERVRQRLIQSGRIPSKP